MLVVVLLRSGGQALLVQHLLWWWWVACWYGVELGGHDVLDLALLRLVRLPRRRSLEVGDVDRLLLAVSLGWHHLHHLELGRRGMLTRRLDQLLLGALGGGGGRLPVLGRRGDEDLLLLLLLGRWRLGCPASAATAAVPPRRGNDPPSPGKVSEAQGAGRGDGGHLLLVVVLVVLVVLVLLRPAREPRVHGQRPLLVLLVLH